MKQIFSLILAGITGGLIVLAGVYLLSAPPGSSSASLPPAQLVRQVNVAPQPAAPLDFKAAAARAMPAVVHIKAKATPGAQELPDEGEDNPLGFFFNDDFWRNPFGGQRPQQGSGSGVLYTSDGYIVTNYHVVEFADELEVTLYDNRTFEAQIVGSYKQSDLAVLKIQGANFPTMELADSDRAEIGEWVLAVGNPFELNSTVTAGIISAKGRNIQLLGGRDAIEAFIQTDAAVNPGNSGGALVDAEGRLLGINTAIATRTGAFQGYSFAIPINLVSRIAEDIIANGSFQRAFLGVSIAELDSEYAEELGLAITQGVVIESLSDSGSAQYAGLRTKDVIVEVDGREIKGVPELQEIIGRARVGDVISVKVNRQGNLIEIPVSLKAE